jgi:uncharacterized protein YjlB
MSRIENGVEHYSIADDGRFPNNATHPLIVYRGVITAPSEEGALWIEERFRANAWIPAWRNGIYDYHHYHSTAHEVLGVYAGRATVRFGGDGGIECDVAAGDVVLIPAGVSHKCLKASRDFALVGAYPREQHPDMCYGKEAERPQADQSIARVPEPDTDPVHGREGPVCDLWPR